MRADYRGSRPISRLRHERASSSYAIVFILLPSPQGDAEAIEKSPPPPFHLRQISRMRWSMASHRAGSGRQAFRTRQHFGLFSSKKKQKVLWGRTDLHLRHISHKHSVAASRKWLNRRVLHGNMRFSDFILSEK
jgi:hypothetical protein